ncbi:RNA-directed DNA polymerase, eukaryota, partial [Tanacetum coccineum]
MTRNTCASIVSSWGEIIDVDEPESTTLSYKKLCVKVKSHVTISVKEYDSSSEGEIDGEDKVHNSDSELDIDNEVDHIWKRNNDKVASESVDPQFPPGFTPVVVEVNVTEDVDLNQVPHPKIDVTNNNKDVSNATSGYNGVSKLKIRRRSGVISLLIMSLVHPSGFLECVLMGDFNKVRTNYERYGTVFNLHGANAFNNFINTTGLVDLLLEGYSYTWSHKYASKMSKLDRFLITEGLLMIFPSLSALCLDRHLSDHRPILLRELNVDYGPIPFRLFHSWFNKNRFVKMVEDSWKDSAITESNSIISLKKKLQALKTSIKQWITVVKL